MHTFTVAVPFISFKQCGKLDSNKNDKYTFTSTWKDRALCSLKFYCCRCTLESINIKSTSIIFILDFIIINKHLASVWPRDFENVSKEIIQCILMTWSTSITVSLARKASQRATCSQLIKYFFILLTKFKQKSYLTYKYTNEL